MRRRRVAWVSVLVGVMLATASCTSDQGDLGQVDEAGPTTPTSGPAESDATPWGELRGMPIPEFSCAIPDMPMRWVTVTGDPEEFLICHPSLDSGDPAGVTVPDSSRDFQRLWRVLALPDRGRRWWGPCLYLSIGDVAEVVLRTSTDTWQVSIPQTPCGARPEVSQVISHVADES